MKLEFIGADHEVTGSCHYLKVGTLNILVDFGMEQGRDVYENTKLPVTPSEVDFVFITHAHIDHTGMLPKLYHDGFRGRIITTEPTMDLCDIMLRDSAHIQTAEAEYRNKRLARKGIYQKIVPAYTMEDAMNVMKLFRSFKYNKKYQLCNGVEFRFTDVGHLLGSASIELWLTENKNGVASGNPVGAPEGTVTKKIVFSGDIGNINQPLLRNPAYTTAADYVVMESTYGDRLHEKRDGDNKNAIAEIIRNTLLRGGNVVIPSFAVGRTQEMLYFIRKIKLEGLFPEMPDFPVYVDSPLAVQATEVFRDNGRMCYDEEASEFLRKGINPLVFPNLNMTITVDESKAINNDDEPKVIIAASGMCDAGRIRHHLKYNLGRKECTILFVGYQAEGTPGRALVEGTDSIHIFGDEIQVRAEILQLPGMSGHADKEGLINWINAFTEQKPSKVFVVHGDSEAADSFTECLKNEYGYDSFAPYSGTIFDLKTGEFDSITEGIPLRKTEMAAGEDYATKGGKTKSVGYTGMVVTNSYTKVRSALKELGSMVEQGSGLPNKELDALAKAMNELVSKYQVNNKNDQEGKQ